MGEVGVVSSRIDYSWVDQQYSSGFNRSDRDLMPSYHRTNIQVRWMSDDRLWDVKAYVRNLEDDDAIVNLFDSNGLVALPVPVFSQYAPPRTFGLSATRNF